MDRSGNGSFSHHACPTEPSSKRSEAVRNVINAIEGFAKRLLPAFHLDVSKYLPRRVSVRGPHPGRAPITWRVPLFFPEEDFAADAMHAIHTIVSRRPSTKGHNRGQLSVNNSNTMAGVTATGTTTIRNSSSMAQEAASTTSATNAPKHESEPLDTTSSQPLSDEEQEGSWKLQEEEYELTLQQLNAQRDKIKQIYDKKKAQIDKECGLMRSEVRRHWWDDRRLNELKRQLEDMTNKLQERRAIEKEWRKEEEEEEDGEESESDDEEDDEDDDEEDDEEEWDPEAAKRRIYKLETLKMRHEWEALYYRMLTEKNDHTIRLSNIEKKRTEALLKVEEEYNRDMYAWYKMRDEYHRREMGEESESRNIQHSRASYVRRLATCTSVVW
ncbi:hypothetical protein B0H65DRAFT_443224 [Neurospora tetraspora]|uniref:Uncharacterized protein n=1 Tax=Neurospora tetraspora TaxID=94610 RepID=A0AAE0JC36_9PEZI|nr:hypothetical protein B0H65DRAFT_443224 [Neurospora tetraspora]